MKRTITQLSILVLALIMMSSPVKADGPTITIDDRVEGGLTASGTGAVGFDGSPDFVLFVQEFRQGYSNVVANFLYNLPVPLTDLHGEVIAFYEPGTDLSNPSPMALSDVLDIYNVGPTDPQYYPNYNTEAAVTFISDYTGQGLSGSLFLPFQISVIETGDFQAFTFYGITVDVASGEEVQVPEPATMLLLGSGLIGLWGFRKKFRK